MGIRFRCPNGHKLHVKAFLAGKRGICPRCSAKFVIPQESDEQLVHDAKHAAAQGQINKQPSAAPLPSDAKPSFSAVEPQNGEQPAAVPGMPVIEVQQDKGQSSAPMSAPLSADSGSKPEVAASEQLTQQPHSPAPGAEASAAPDPITEAPHAVWYVRPPSGGQYGPASGDIMRTWIAEGRVTLDSLVWREGWPEWKKAGPLFPGLLTSEPVVSESEVPRIVTEGTHGSSLELYRRRSSSMNTLSVVVMLMIACFVLFGALVYVVKYMN